MAYLLAQVPWLGIYLGHLGVGGPVRVVVEHCHKEIARRLAKGPSSRDLLFYLVCVSFGLRPTICLWFRGGQNNEDLPSKGPPPRGHLLNDGIVAMGAASETISGALVSIFHCLLSNPEAYASLQDEIDRFYPQGTDTCSTAHHRNMHYLTAVMYVPVRTILHFSDVR